MSVHVYGLIINNKFKVFGLIDQIVFVLLLRSWLRDVFSGQVRGIVSNVFTINHNRLLEESACLGKCIIPSARQTVNLYASWRSFAVFDSVVLKVLFFSGRCELQTLQHPTCAIVCRDALCFIPFFVGVYKKVVKTVDDKAMKTIARTFSDALGPKHDFMIG